jgi:hypothetical protein
MGYEKPAPLGLLKDPRDPLSGDGSGYTYTIVVE